ncbi:MAG: type II toxin-antitoxin system VapC family toxin [Pseudomonadota bacterium]
MYLIDTNVISAARRSGRHPALSAWLRSQDESNLYLSVISVGEIARGIRLQSKKNAPFAAELAAWLDRTERLFADRLLPFDAQAARIWGDLSATIGHPGADLMIAATALSRDATVVTGNVSDFEPTGVRIYDPFRTDR